MKERILKLDERIDAAFHAEWSAAEPAVAAFRKQLHESWVFNDLHIEGVPLTREELERALQGLEGLDHCDRECMSRVRRMDRVVRVLRQHAQEGRTLTLDDLRDYASLLLGEEPEPRTQEGATEAYKHDVVPAEEAVAASERALETLAARFHEEHPLELAFDLHEALCKAWPFQQGSAAVARLAMNETLLAHGYPPLILPASARQAYYQALHHDIRRFTELALDTLERQLDLREKVFSRSAAPAGGLRAL